MSHTCAGRRAGFVVVVACLPIGLATPAMAQWSVSPMVGVANGGNLQESRLSYGVVFGRQVHRRLGLEGDVVGVVGAFESLFPRGANTHSSITTVSFNATMTVATRRNVDVFLLGGLGAIRSHLEGPGGSYSQTNLLVSGGGGVVFGLTGRTGLRIDLRYLKDTDDLVPGLSVSGPDFWRTTAGVGIRIK